MAFDIQVTQRSLPGRSGGVPFQADLSTGQADVAAATGRLAGAGQDLVLTLNEMQAKTQLSEFRRKQKEEYDAAAFAIESELDSTKYEKIYSDAMDRAKQFLPTNKKARGIAEGLIADARVQGKTAALASGRIREMDTLRADDVQLLAEGKFEQYRRSVQANSTNFLTYDKEEAQKLIAASRVDEAKWNRQAHLDDLAKKGIALALTPEFAGPLKANEWLSKQEGLSSAERNEIEGRINGAVADQKKKEDNRVAKVRAELTQRLYAEKGATTETEVHNAMLPGELVDSLVAKIRNRDKDIIEEKKVVTSSRTRADINDRIGFVVSGESTVEQAVQQYLRDVDQDVAVTERGAVITAFYKAGKDNTDEKKRQNQTILGERERQLRDAINRNQGIVAFVQEESREILADLANDAANELNDRFRSLDFTTVELDAVVDDLKRKYSLSETALSQAEGTRKFLAETKREEQVLKLRADIEAATTQEEKKALLDQGMKVGLVDESGNVVGTGSAVKSKKSDSTSTLEGLKRLIK